MAVFLYKVYVISCSVIRIFFFANILSFWRYQNFTLREYADSEDDGESDDDSHEFNIDTEADIHVD